MRNTYWYAVDYDGTGHLFIYKPERDTGIWKGEEAIRISKGVFQSMFPGLTWQDAPMAVLVEILPREETAGLKLSKILNYYMKKCVRFSERKHDGRVSFGPGQTDVEWHRIRDVYLPINAPHE